MCSIKKTPAETGVFESTAKTVRAERLLAVVTDRLDRATLEGLRAKRDILRGCRLLDDKGVTAVVIAAEESRCRLSAQIAVDTLLIDIELTGSVRGPFFSFICHR